MLPDQFIQAIQNALGFNEPSFKEVHASGQQITSIRLNPLKQSSVTLFDNAQQVPWCAHGKYLPERPSFTFDPLFHGGAYYVQEASSMFLWQALTSTLQSTADNLKVLDLCAAPGGKSTLLASYLPNALIVSNETIRSRAAILYENVVKWGTDNIAVTNNDPKDFQQLPGYFDMIVVDAPCSGSGLFRKDPEAIKEWSAESVMLCSQRQQRILADVFSALKEEGILIYSTCSYSVEEDEEISDWLVDTFDVKSVRIATNNEWGIVETTTQKHQCFGYRFYPDKLRGEGFFIAAFRKNKVEKELFKKTYALGTISKKDEQFIHPWLYLQEPYHFFTVQENVLAVKQQWQAEIALLQKLFYLKKAGVAVGSIKKNDFVPAHELAVSPLVNKTNVDVVALNPEQAIQYLKKKEIEYNILTKGWKLITCQHINLGWIKNLHNRVNNYYPSEWRILKD